MAHQSTLAGIKVGDGQPVRIMGVINVSPESFYVGSIQDRRSIAKAARRMEEEGADFVDIGAMSTAPYLKTAISEKEEAERLDWAVRMVKKACRLPISIDTMRAAPAAAALKAGGRIVNDVSGLRADPRMGAAVKNADGLILMAHPSGINSKLKPSIKPISAVEKLLRDSLERAGAFNRSKITLDPGIGFFRHQPTSWWEWDSEVLNHLKSLRALKRPLLVGISRKSFIGKFLGGKPPEERLYGSLAATVISVANGASIVRTHDVAATIDAVKVAERILKDGKELRN